MLGMENVRDLPPLLRGGLGGLGSQLAAGHELRFVLPSQRDPAVRKPFGDRRGADTEGARDLSLGAEVMEQVVWGHTAEHTANRMKVQGGMPYMIRRSIPAVPDKYKTVGERIRGYRMAAGVVNGIDYANGVEFAKLMGIKPSSLSDLETGDSKIPSAEAHLRAAQALGLDPWYLLTGDGPKIRSVTQLRPNEMRFLLLYRDLGGDEQTQLEVQANVLHNQAHPEKSAANPYGGKVPSKPKRR